MQNLLAFAVLLLTALPIGSAGAQDAPQERTRPDRLVFALRADFAQIHSHSRDFFAMGGSLGVHIPLADLPLGVGVLTSLTAGDGHLASTTDLSLRYYLPISGRDPGGSLQPYARAGASLSIISWDEQDVSTAVGGVLGLGLQAWVSDPIAIDFELSYRVLGGPELRQTMIGSVGVAFGN